MEHEVFVPVPAETLRQTLADPARVARCVPGLQQDADASAGPLAGRLKIRVGGHTITYRGALRITGQGDDFAVEGEGTEARGSGSAKLALTLRLTPAEGGTTLTFTGTAHADGRLAEADAATVAQAGTRLLDRFASSLASKATADGKAEDAPQDPTRPDDSTEPGPSGGRPEDAGATRASTEAQAGPGKSDADGTPGGEQEGPAGAGSTDDAVTRPSGDDDGTPAADAEPAPGPGENGADEAQRADAADAPGADASGADASVYDVEVPPSALDPLADEAFGDGEEPPAEAAHARRTMIGRSAEEVDHAPPRGRYAPVPAPGTGTAGSTLRWVAPAAALALASAVVVGRALRRRK
ncbi:SRPBCC domain-containing protein [Streptomyces sp. NPDC006678]|uniref:SRPBCC family protein n=1 Tax=Streptomyces sp. NPDC006678 TaxID=3157185 RepID=UPI0033F33E63